MAKGRQEDEKMKQKMTAKKNNEHDRDGGRGLSLAVLLLSTTESDWTSRPSIPFHSLTSAGMGKLMEADG